MGPQEISLGVNIPHGDTVKSLSSAFFLGTERKKCRHTCELMNWTEIDFCLMLPPALYALVYESGLVKLLLSNI